MRKSSETGSGRHCVICGEAVTGKRMYCDECRRAVTKQQRRERNETERRQRMRTPGICRTCGAPFRREEKWQFICPDCKKSAPEREREADRRRRERKKQLLAGQAVSEERVCRTCGAQVGGKKIYCPDCLAERKRLRDAERKRCARQSTQEQDHHRRCTLSELNEIARANHMSYGKLSALIFANGGEVPGNLLRPEQVAGERACTSAFRDVPELDEEQ